MTLRTRTVKISGVSSDNGWSQSFEYTAENDPKSKNHSLFIVFSTIRKNTELDDAILGREILDKFRSEYYVDENKLPDTALKDAVKNIFNDFFQKLDGLEIAAGSYADGTFYVSCINGGKASLFRDGFLVKILDSVSPQPVSASGYPKEGDIMVLATSDFYKGIALSEIKESFTKGLEVTKDVFSMKLHNIATASVVLIGFTRNGNNENSDNISSDEYKPINNVRERTNIKIQKLSGFLNKIKSLLPKKSIYLHRQNTEILPIKSKKTVFVGIVLTILLGVSVFFGIYKNKKDTYINSYADTLSSAKADIEDAVRLKNVEIGQSRELFIKGRDLLVSLKDDGVKDPEINRLFDMVSQNSSDILGEKKVVSDLWLDLTLVSDGFSSEEVVSDGTAVYIPDYSKNIILSVDLTTKKSSTIKIPSEIGGPEALTVRANRIFVLGNGGIYELSKKQKIIDKNWDGFAYISAYASNIYILDTKKGEILRAVGTETGFSEGKKWTTSESEDFSGIKSFSIDGFAWVLKSGSEIKKYSYGNRIKFELKGYPYTLPEYDRLYTIEDQENMYLLSRSDKTISVFSKDGGYKYNLISDTVSDTKDFIVSESSGKIILLTGGKLYLLPLSN